MPPVSIATRARGSAPRRPGPYAAPPPEAPGLLDRPRPPLPLRVAGGVVVAVGGLATALAVVALGIAGLAAFDDRPSRVGTLARLGLPFIVALLFALFLGGGIRRVGRLMLRDGSRVVAGSLVLVTTGVLSADLALRSHLTAGMLDWAYVVPGRRLDVVATAAGPDLWGPQRAAALAVGAAVVLGLLGALAGALTRGRVLHAVLVLVLAAVGVTAASTRVQVAADEAAARRAAAVRACTEVGRLAGEPPGVQAVRCSDPYSPAARLASG